MCACKGAGGLLAQLAACVSLWFRCYLYVPEIPNDQNRHHQGAEGHGIPNRVNEIQPIEELLLQTKKCNTEIFPLRHKHSFFLPQRGTVIVPAASSDHLMNKIL